MSASMGGVKASRLTRAWVSIQVAGVSSPGRSGALKRLPAILDAIDPPAHVHQRPTSRQGLARRSLGPVRESVDEQVGRGLERQMPFDRQSFREDQPRTRHLLPFRLADQVFDGNRVVRPRATDAASDLPERRHPDLKHRPLKFVGRIEGASFFTRVPYCDFRPATLTNSVGMYVRDTGRRSVACRASTARLSS